MARLEEASWTLLLGLPLLILGNIHRPQSNLTLLKPLEMSCKSDHLSFCFIFICVLDPCSDLDPRGDPDHALPPCEPDQMRVLAPRPRHLPLGGLGSPGEELHLAGEEGDHLGVLGFAEVSCGFHDVVKMKGYSKVG